MVNLVYKNSNALSTICSEDVFGTRIQGYYDTYGSDFDFVQVWIQTDGNGNPSAAMSLIGGDMTLTCNDNADYEELSLFIGMTDYSTLQCEKEVMKKLGIKETLSGYIVEYKKERPVDSDSVNYNVDFKQMYSLIKSEGLLGVGDYLPWLSDITYRVNHGKAKAAAVIENGTVSSCAAALFVTEKAALLGAVATDKKRRGNGFARTLVQTLGNEMLKSGRRTELLCRNDSIVEFYKSSGFDVNGRWSMFLNEKY